MASTRKFKKVLRLKEGDNFLGDTCLSFDRSDPGRPEFFFLFIKAEKDSSTMLLLLTDSSGETKGWKFKDSSFGPILISLDNCNIFF